MEARLCVLARSVVLYPQAGQPDDRGGRLRGFVQLECRAESKIEALRLRLMGFAQTVIDQDAAIAKADDRQGGQFSVPAQVFVMREATLRRIGTSEAVAEAGISRLTKGKHVLTFEVTIPHNMPATQHTVFCKVYYQLIFFARGRPVKSFFSLDFTVAPVVPLLVEVHPSTTGGRGLNAINQRFHPTSDVNGIHATIDSNNARWGGCFNVVLHHPITNDKHTIKVVHLSLVLEQCWTVRGKRVEAGTTKGLIADIGALKSDRIEAVEDTLEWSEPGGGREIRVKQSFYDRETTGEEMAASSTASAPSSSRKVLASAVQQIKFHSFFPQTAGCTATKEDVSNAVHEWQATTPPATSDEVRVEHSLTLVVRFCSAGPSTDDDIQLACFSTPICLVNEHMRTDELQLPPYSVINGAHQDGATHQDLYPPPILEEWVT